MTIVTQIITDAFRQSNLLAIGVEPTTLQKDEALRYLNRLVKSTFGNEAGDAFVSFPVGRNGIQRPSGYPWWDTVPDNDWFVPIDNRIMLNLDSPIGDLWLHPDPGDGARFALIDVAQTLSQFPVEVHGNGRRIETNTSIVLSTDGLDREWFYRADLGNWQLYSPMVLVDVFCFPEEFDDFFITMLAIRLNPSYGSQLDPQSQLVLNRSRTQLRARYNQVIPVRSELALIRPAKVAADRDQWGSTYHLYQPNAMFDKGWPW